MAARQACQDLAAALYHKGHYNFVKEGVPSVFLIAGFGNGGDKVFGDLPFNWAAGAKFARINSDRA